MKIIALLEHDVAGGGGFNQALNAVLQAKRLCDGRFDFEVFTTLQQNARYLQDLGLRAEIVSISLIDRLLSWLSMHRWWHSVQRRLRLVGGLEKKLRQHGCDLAYFVTPSGIPAALQTTSYIATIWDLCHRDNPEFPEVRQFGEFHAREHLYRSGLAPAYLVVTDSPALAAATAHRYGIDPERLLAMPFAPSPFINDGRATARSEVLSRYALNEGYFFYPAQFWAHKNHIRILEALLILRSRRSQIPHVVFAGGDQGVRRHVEAFVQQAGLTNQVRLLGYVAAEDMRGLYEACTAVVMPTYFGPTNIPPLEAWLTGKPLIYSSQFSEQAGDAAILVDPDDARQLADAMEACGDAEQRARLVSRGRTRLELIEQQRKKAEAELLSRLQKFEARRMCWT